MFLTEALKFKEGKRIESQFDKIKRIIKKKVKNKVGYDEKKLAVECEKMEEVIQEVFNFQTVIIHMEDGKDLNAFTFPISTYGDSYYEKNDNNYKFKNKEGKVIVIALLRGLLEFLTASELTAVLLHEIGHSFYHAGFLKKINDLTYEYLLFSSDYKEEAIKEVNKSRKKNKLNKKENVRRIEVFKFLGKVGNEIIKFVLKIVFMMGWQLSLMIRLFLPFIGNLFKLMFSEGYNNELFADKFVAEHDYSESLVTAFVKFDSHGVTKSSGLNSIKKLGNDLLVLIELMYVDEHPSSHTRIKEIISYKEDDYKKAKDSRIKKQLKRELNYTRELLKIQEKNAKEGLLLSKEQRINKMDSIDKLKNITSFSTSSVNELSLQEACILLEKRKYERKENSLVGNSSNAPNFAYKTVYGKLPKTLLTGRTGENKKEWNGLMVDGDFEDVWLNNLDDLPVEIRSTDSGKSEERVAFVIFRMKEKEEKLAPEISKLLNKEKNIYSLCELGMQKKYRICVAGKVYKEKDEKKWEKWWKTVDGIILKAYNKSKKEREIKNKGLSKLIRETTNIKKMKEAEVFFLPTKTRPGTLGKLNKKMEYWHTGIIYDNKVYECLNNSKYSITKEDERVKELSKQKAIYIEKKIDIKKLESEIKSGTSCSTYVARCLGIDDSKGSEKTIYPDELYEKIEEDVVLDERKKEREIKNKEFLNLRRKTMFLSENKEKKILDCFEIEELTLINEKEEKDILDFLLEKLDIKENSSTFLLSEGKEDKKNKLEKKIKKFIKESNKDLEKVKDKRKVENKVGKIITISVMFLQLTFITMALLSVSSIVIPLITLILASIMLMKSLKIYKEDKKLKDKIEGFKKKTKNKKVLEKLDQLSEAIDDSRKAE